MAHFRIMSTAFRTIHREQNKTSKYIR